jgi:hypothetical protein
MQSLPSQLLPYLHILSDKQRLLLNDVYGGTTPIPVVDAWRKNDRGYAHRENFQRAVRQALNKLNAQYKANR